MQQYFKGDFYKKIVRIKIKNLKNSCAGNVKTLLIISTIIKNKFMD